MTSRALYLSLGLMLATLLGAGSGRAATECRGTLGRDHRLYIEAYDTSAAFPEIDAKLSKGLAVTIVSQVRWAGHPELVFGCKIYYDLWDEAYYLTTLRGSLAAVGDRRTTKSRADALKACYTATLDGDGAGAKSFDLTTLLDPVSDEVLAKTRQWLAEKGISGTSAALFGRAAYAIVDLKQQQAISRSCAIGGSP